MKTKVKKRIHVGTYQLGFQWVDLWMDPKLSGGEFVSMPDGSKDRAKITVGVEGALWASWGILVHEVSEHILCELHVRFRPTNHYVNSASDLYHFAFNHNQFTELCARLGSFLCECRADFERAWKKCQ
jgi:hypothetical protein